MYVNTETTIEYLPNPKPLIVANYLDIAKQVAKKYNIMQRFIDSTTKVISVYKFISHVQYVHISL